MESYYQTGDQCVLRGIVKNQLWLVQSMIVVKDNRDESILLLLPGAQCAIPKEYGRWRETGKKAKVDRWQIARRNPLIPEEFTWQRNRILFFLEPEKYFSFCFGFMRRINLFIIMLTSNSRIHEAIVVLTHWIWTSTLLLMNNLLGNGRMLMNIKRGLMRAA